MSGGAEGLALLDKPIGITSFQALSHIKMKLKTRKVGHTGTLDPFASGLLVALTGRYTTLADYVSSMDKLYRAEITFGMETDTLDPEGKVVKQKSVPTESAIVDAVKSFQGEISQIPPVFSAVHVGGERAYRLARQGKKPALSARTVRIENIDIIGYAPPILTVSILCSKGTYVRALARDMGSRAGSCAFVSALRRLQMGAFRSADAVVPENFEPERHLWAPERFLPFISRLESRVVRISSVGKICCGGVVSDGDFENPPRDDGDYALMDREDGFLAIVNRKECRYRYRKVFCV